MLTNAFQRLRQAGIRVQDSRPCFLQMTSGHLATCAWAAAQKITIAESDFIEPMNCGMDDHNLG